jgi:hypothetical protein
VITELGSPSSPAMRQDAHSQLAIRCSTLALLEPTITIAAYSKYAGRMSAVRIGRHSSIIRHLTTR